MLTLERPDGSVVATGVTDVAKAAQGRKVYCSSTIDFPEEHTTDLKTVAFCKELPR